jgi:uncharacterized protein YjiS (DUF1127 family)
MQESQLILSQEFEEPKSSNLIGKLSTELSVQVWQFITDTLTSYRQIIWLRQRQQTRAQLLDLSDEQLKDIGISRVAAEQEANKWFWE